MAMAVLTASCHGRSSVRANQAIPRSFHDKDLLRRFPPPPSVEDEAESIAREHGGSVVNSSSEEPKFPGDIDQHPILLPVHENNPERRFVLVSPSETAEEQDPIIDGGAADPLPQPKEEYEANTCRKYVLLDPEEEEAKRPQPQRRKSRLELPRIETDVHPNPRSANFHRTRSATYIDQKPRDYFDRQNETSTPSRDVFLSPQTANVIKHATKGRERAYLDFNPGNNEASARNRPSANDPRAVSTNERRNGPLKASYSPGAPLHKRASSAIEVPRGEFRRTSDRYGSYREEISSPRLRRRDPSPPPLDRKRSSPPRRERRDSMSERTLPERKNLSRRNSTYGNRPSPPRDDELHYSSDENAKRQSSRRSERRKSFLYQEKPVNLLSPDQARPPPLIRQKSRTTTPLASPRVSQTQFPDPELIPSPRSSRTFPQARDRRQSPERPVSPFSSGDSASPRSSSRLRMDDNISSSQALSRTPSIKSNAGTATSKPVIMPIPIPTNSSSSPTERRRSPIPPPYVRQSSLEASPPLTPPKPYWQPAPFQPPFTPPQSPPSQSGTNLDQPIVSYRRYSEDVSQGVLPGLPDCPHQTAEAGYEDWLTLPRCDNFNLCRSCYDQVFAGTDFRSHFIAARRPKDKEILCDLGTSPWYRIAWLMTRKYRHPDLRLLQGIAHVEAKNQPCSGGHMAVRTWWSIKDPYSGRCIQDFNVCYHCAKAVEVLFPNLLGVFVPVDSPGPTRDICSLHFAPDRKRFNLYFDLLEGTYDRAVANKSAPNIPQLATKVRHMSPVGECARDDVVRGGAWHMMERLQEFTVCEECFHDVVFPELEAGSMVARNFYQKPQRLRRAACQLYSQRMRDVFRRACQKDDFKYLQVKVRERLDIEMDIKNSLQKIDDHGPQEAFREEVEKLVREWRKWE